MAFGPKKVGGLFSSSPAPVVVGVAAFGKHPAYADHLPLDVGDQSPLSARLRQIFYNGGLLTRVGDFDALQKAGKAIPFGHFILYREIDPQSAAGEASALVRLWPSRDSVNRSDIPMILAACGTGVPAAWILKNGADVLTSAEPRCVAATTLEELTAAATSATADLRARAEAADPVPDAQPPAASAELVAALRAIREYLPMDGPSKFTMPDRPATARAVPLGPTPLESIAAWSALLDTALAGRVARYFLIAPDNGQWVDLILGEPAGKHFLCIRSGPAALPIITAGPEELTDTFGKSAAAWLGKLSGKPPVPEPAKAAAPAPPLPRPAAPVAPPAPRPESGTAMKLVGGAAVVVAAIAVGGYFVFRGGSAPEQSTAQAPPAQAAPAPTPAPQPAPTAPAPAPQAVQPTPTPAPAPAPAPPPPVVEADPRPGWNLATLKEDLAAVQRNAAAVAQLKANFADIPAVTDAVKDPPDPKPIAAAIADVENAQWPRDKDVIQQRKADLDLAKTQLALPELKSPDYPAKAWTQALAALRKLKFQSPDVQSRWDKLAADPHLVAGYSPDLFAVSLPDAYHRLAALDQAAGSTPSPDALAATLDTALADKSATPDSVAGDYRQRVQQAGRRAAAAAAAQSAVQQADALLSQPDPSPAKLNAAMAQLSAIAVADLGAADAAAIKQRQGDIDALSQSHGLAVSSPVDQIKSARTVALAVALWRNWTAAGPTGRPLDEDAEVRAVIRTKCSDPAFTKELDDASRSRWIARFGALFNASAPPDDAALQSLVAAAADAQVPEPAAALTGLPRANYLLYCFKAQLSQPLPPAQAVTAAKQFIANLAGQMPAVTVAINQALNPPASPGDASGPDGRPGVTRISGDRDSAVVKYSCLGTTLSFVRVGNSYLAADEFPAGLFVNLVNQQKWTPDDLDIRISYIDQKDDRGLLERLIPRSWDWDPDQSRMALHSAWITTGDASEDAFVNAGKDDHVTADSPVQYISPKTALKLADFLGCRLPSAAEWQAAQKLGGPATPRITAADRAAYLARLSTIKARPPTNFMFVSLTDAPADAPATIPPRVWFSPVKSDSDSLRNLDGNLAEFVTDGSDMKIAGASAWSGDAAKPDALHEIDPAKPHYADVGFRLAFSAPPTPPAALLRKIAVQTPYQLATH